MNNTVVKIIIQSAKSKNELRIKTTKKHVGAKRIALERTENSKKAKERAKRSPRARLKDKVGGR